MMEIETSDNYSKPCNDLFEEAYNDTCQVNNRVMGFEGTLNNYLGGLGG